MKCVIFLLLPLAFVFSCKTEHKNTSLKTTNVSIKKLENTVLSGGNLYRIDALQSNYIKPRPVDIWLPENYSEDKKYPVLYMHDGQMLFDATTSWNKQEWNVDEWASKLMLQGKTKNFIVVGIHNIPEIRWQDLFPQKALNYLNKTEKDSLFKKAKKQRINFKGDAYLKFLVKELKPVIDANYAVYTDREHTYVAGSSMGGLMSMYALIEYPEIFKAAACLSTHWVGGEVQENNPFPDAIFKYMQANLPKAGKHKIYFDYGNKTLDAHYPQYASRVDNILEAKGYTNKDSKNLFFEGTDHSENSWNKRLDMPLTFLLHK